MITIYKNKKDIPQEMEYVELNDVFFNQNTAGKFDKRACVVFMPAGSAAIFSG